MQITSFNRVGNAPREHDGQHPAPSGARGPLGTRLNEGDYRVYFTSLTRLYDTKTVEELCILYQQRN